MNPATVATLLAGALVVARLRPHRVHRVPGSTAGSPPGLPAALHAAVRRADLAARVRAPGRSWGAAVLVGTVAGLLVGGAGGAVVGLLVGTVGPPVVVLARGDRRPGRLTRDLPVALDTVASSLRAGSSMPGALADAAAAFAGTPVGDDLGIVVVEVRAGVPLLQALDRWTARRPVAAVRLAASALSLAAEVGGAQARTVDEVAAVLREQQGLEDEIRVQASQARASAMVVGAAPLAFAGLLVVLDPARAVAMWRTPVGLGALVAGVGLDLLGIAWMRRVVRMAGAVR